MIKLAASHTEDLLFLTLIHAIQEKFTNHAILKGGMVLKLLGSNRKTLDIDYTFVPFKSKNDVWGDLKQLCASIEGASVHTSVNSKAIRLLVKTETAQVQVEVNVSEQCKSVPMSTGELSKNFGIAPRVIRVMSYDVSLANKLAAWFERRLIRDLYDIYFISTVAGPSFDMPTLIARLNKIESRIPKLKKVKKISIENFALELTQAVQELDEKSIKAELSAFLRAEEIIGLDLLIRKSVLQLIRAF